MRVQKLLPLLGMLLVLGGCTGSCAPGTQPVPTSTPLPTQTVRPSAPASTVPLPPSPSPVPETGEPVLVDPIPMPTPTPRPIPQTPSPTPTPPPESTPAAGPSDEAVLAAYRQAVEAFGWFRLTHLPLDMAQPAQLDGQLYYRVDYPGIDTLAGLRGYLKGLFSDALVEALLPAGATAYVEIDGVLYGIDGGRGGDITKGAETIQVLRDADENRRTVHVTVELLDPEADFAPVGSEEHNFPYEKIGEAWIFTDFYLIR